MKTAVVVQARMGSNRLPGKVMKTISGRPMIDWVLMRAADIPGVDGVVVATSTEPREEPLVQHLRQMGVDFHRGPEENVLTRYRETADRFGLETVVRITSDCPLLMPEVSGRVLRVFSCHNCDYASNTLDRTYPRGLDTEVVRAEVLAQAAQEATSDAAREHVTPFIRNSGDCYRLCSVTADTDRSELRWTVDVEKDLQLIRRVYALLPDPMAGYHAVLTLLDKHPRLQKLNREIRQESI